MTRDEMITHMAYNAGYDWQKLKPYLSKEEVRELEEEADACLEGLAVLDGFFDSMILPDGLKKYIEAEG